MTTPINREAWLENAKDALLNKVFFPVSTSTPINLSVPEKIRIACSWPSRNAGPSNRRAIGQNFSPAASADGTNEIIISMVLDDPIRVLDVLTHELVHALVGNEHGHKGPFRTLAKAVGLEGKMTATVAGEELTATLKEIYEELGEYPHAQLDISNVKKQSTRLIKMECNDCGFIARASRKAIEDAGLPTCGCGGSMDTDM